MGHPIASTTSGCALLRRVALTTILGAGLALVAIPGLAFAADPSAEPEPSAGVGTLSQPTAAPTATPEPPSTPPPAPTPTPTPTVDPAPAPTQEPAPAVPPPATAPRTMNLFVASQFRFQDPNYVACTATSARTMLNLIAVKGTGGQGFLWRPTIWNSVRDAIMRWERTHDTLAGGYGSDPHGWRNALNYYGWGAATMLAGSRVYDDVSYGTFDAAMKDAVRALAATGKPVGLLGWRGAHAQMITGYYGLVGDPFAKDAAGRYLNAFSVGGFYLTDPLRATAAVNRPIATYWLRYTANYRIRFQRYYETDSRYDDPYTPGYRVSREEWYGRFVLVLPVR